MLSERKPEIPLGYTTRNAPEINATFVLPINWHYRKRVKESGYLYELSGERLVTPISSNKYDTVDFNKTICAIETLTNVQKLSSVKPSDWAQAYLGNVEFDLVSNIERKLKDNLPTLRGIFISKKARIDGVEVDTRKILCEITTNDLTDKIYIIHFETPASRWDENEAIAETMVSKRVFDPNF